MDRECTILGVYFTRRETDQDVKKALGEGELGSRDDVEFQRSDETMEGGGGGRYRQGYLYFETRATQASFRSSGNDSNNVPLPLTSSSCFCFSSCGFLLFGSPPFGSS
ncbi:hypothetical protein Bca52824_022136 [Brassica carinata]|uniref:Uncharacterized protein n=1 Tax=Brassica carinata TaxID=52824 RepID=A0A8X7VG53_BRACI|nr:hypothetical protein Bca52824_022136 [Brassica carinata]